LTMTIDFEDLKVISFETRQADKIADLIIQAGGRPVVVPSMREVPLEQNTEALRFAKLLLAGWIDALALMTGVGTRLLVESVATKYDTGQFIEALRQTEIIALGPKPVAALQELGLSPTISVPEPYTWHDLLDILDEKYPITEKRIAVQEYGQSNPELVKGLRERGAEVISVPLYRWELPEDLTPLHNAARDIISENPRKVDLCLFTSATQVRHLFKVAEMDGIAEQLREAFKKVCIASVGPIASRAIAEQGLTVEV